MAAFDITLPEVAPEFAFILDRGLSQTEGQRHTERGDAATVVCSGPALGLSFERDAFGYVSVATVHPCGNAFPLTEALQFLKIDFADPQQDPARTYASSMDVFRIGLDEYVALYGPPTTMARQAIAAEANWNALVDLFTSEHRCASFNVFTQARARKRLDLYARRSSRPKRAGRSGSIWTRLTGRRR